MRRARRSIVPLVLVLSLATVGGIPAGAAEPPSVRLFAATTHMTVERSGRSVWLDPGVWVASVGGAFELRASRPDYDTPVGLTQNDAETGAVLRTLPAELLDGWSGLADFIHISVRDADDRLVTRTTYPFCPNTYSRARLSDAGPINSVYPYICGGNPFTRGTVWGIDDQWAVNPIGDYGFSFDGERGNYQVRMWIDPAWTEALGIAPEDTQALVQVKVTGRAGSDEPVEPPVHAPAGGALVPNVTNPPAGSLPDLVALPAWGIGVYERRGREYLAFNATEWNAGPGTLVVEGFRGVDEDQMDAFQYFHVDGEAVGRTPIGAMEFHPHHQHWHFRQFTEYSLLDADSGEVAISGKRSWCLANTDAIDLAVANANWDAYAGDLFTMCGGPGALWIREILDVGWGDTYSQSIAGQAFDITDLPNGTYFIRVQVNPTGSMLEGSTENNVEDRLIRIRGREGNRYVVVPPWHGIDTEACQYYC